MSRIHPNLRLSALGFVTHNTQTEQARASHPLWIGNHLRWTFNMRLRLPRNGFDVYRANGKLSSEKVEATQDQIAISGVRGGDLLRVFFHKRPPTYCELHGFQSSGRTHLLVFDRGRQIQRFTYSEGLPNVVRIQASVFDVIQLYGSELTAGAVLIDDPTDPKHEWQKLAHIHALPELLHERDAWQSVVDRLPSDLPPSRAQDYKSAWEALLELYREDTEGVLDEEPVVISSEQERISVNVMQQISLLSLDPYFAALVGLYFVDGPHFPGRELPASELGETFRYRIVTRWPGQGEDVAISEPVGSAHTTALRSPERPRAMQVLGVVQFYEKDLGLNHKWKELRQPKEPPPPKYRFRVAIDWEHEVQEMCEVQRAVDLSSIPGVRQVVAPRRSLEWSEPDWHLQVNNTLVDNLPARVVDIIHGPEHDVIHRVRVLDSWGRLSPWSGSTRLVSLRSDMPLPCPENPKIEVIDPLVPRLRLSWQYPQEAAQLAKRPIRFILVRLPDEIQPSLSCDIRAVQPGMRDVSVNADLPPITGDHLVGAFMRQGRTMFPIKALNPGVEYNILLNPESHEAAAPAMLLPTQGKAEIMLDLTQPHYWQPVGDERRYKTGKTLYEVDFEQPELRPTLDNPKRYPRYGVYAADKSRRSVVAGPIIAPLFLATTPPSPEVPYTIDFNELGVDSARKRWIRLDWPEQAGYRYQVLRANEAWLGILFDRIADSDKPDALIGLKIRDILEANPERMRMWLCNLSQIHSFNQAFSLLNGAPCDSSEARDFLPANVSNNHFVYLVRLLNPVGNISNPYAVGVFNPTH